MRVSDFLTPFITKGRKKSRIGRNRVTYRAARRNIAKIDYRRAKKGKA